VSRYETVWKAVGDLFTTVDAVADMTGEHMAQFREGDTESDYVLGDRCAGCTFRPQVASHCLARDFGVPVPARVCNSKYGLRPKPIGPTLIVAGGS